MTLMSHRTCPTSDEVVKIGLNTLEVDEGFYTVVEVVELTSQ